MSKTLRVIMDEDGVIRWDADRGSHDASGLPLQVQVSNLSSGTSVADIKKCLRHHLIRSRALELYVVDDETTGEARNAVSSSS